MRLRFNALRSSTSALPLALALAVGAPLAACADDPPPPAEYPPPPDPRPPATDQQPQSAQQASQSGEEIQIGVDGDQYSDTDPSALNDFKPALESHGTWTDDQTYGTVWVPNSAEVGTDFVPYQSGGHWVYDTDYVWVSDYEWGWAPFHYGRWVWIEGRGWAWIPGRVYSGGWVVWRTGPVGYEYVGWGPMPPAFIWYGGVAVVVYERPYPRYVYCARGDVFAPAVATRVVPSERAAVIAQETHPYTPEPTHASAGRAVAQPSARGPAPSALGIEPSHVAAPAPGDRGVSRAQTYARPSTAQPQGATPASPHVVRAPPAPTPFRPRPQSSPPPAARPRSGGGGRHR